MNKKKIKKHIKHKLTSLILRQPETDHHHCHSVLDYQRKTLWTHGCCLKSLSGAAEKKTKIIMLWLNTSIDKLFMCTVFINNSNLSSFDKLHAVRYSFQMSLSQHKVTTKMTKQNSLTGWQYKNITIQHASV